MKHSLVKIILVSVIAMMVLLQPSGSMLAKSGSRQEAAIQTTAQMTFCAVSAGGYAGSYIAFYKNGVEVFRKRGGGSGGRGIGVWALDGQTGAEVRPPRVFDTWGDRLTCRMEAATEDQKDQKTQLANYLKSLPNGVVILLAVGDEAGLTWWSSSRCTLIDNPCTAHLLQTLESLGCKLVRKTCYWDSWSAALVKGENQARDEQGMSALDSPAKSASACIQLPLVSNDSACYSLTITPSTVAPGGQLNVCWSVPGGRSAYDWIGIFSPTDPNTNYGTWFYTNGAATGCRLVTAPTVEKQYEARYLLANAFGDAARGNLVTVKR